MDPDATKAISLINAGKFVDAQALLKQTLKSHRGKDTGLIHTLLGNCHRNLGQTSLAVDDFKKALLTNPNSDAYLNNLGLALLEEKNLTNPVNYLNKL